MQLPLTKQVKYKQWHGFLFLAVIFVAIVLGVVQSCQNKSAQKDSGSDIVETIKITQQSCELAGGLWDPCGSACGGMEAEVCIEVCVEYCYCVYDSQCPHGYYCGAVHNMGVCMQN